MAERMVLGCGGGKRLQLKEMYKILNMKKLWFNESG